MTLVTNLAKERFIDAQTNGWAIQVTHFAVGNRGHSVASPINALSPDAGLNPTADPSGDSLPPDMVFGPKAITSVRRTSGFSAIYTATLDKGEGTGEISSYYLLAKFVYPDPGADTTHALYGLYNTLWIYSYTNTPLKIKTSNEVFTVALGIQY